jgi:2-polyprenyl-6-methoxyphenol hydroxylase-like FAD-dependent oxidoreductase
MPRCVLVAGAGPVGLTMAAELARYRVPVRIIDEAPSRTDKSKALAVWPRTLELLDRAGCAGAFAASGLKAAAITMLSGKQAIARVAFDDVASPFRYLLMIPQSETERLLEAHLGSLGVKVERSVALTGFAQSEECVSCTLRRPDGSDETFEAGWLIGCDGAHSLVRQTLGMAFAGDTLPTTFLLADLHVAGLDVPETELAIFWHHDGSVIFFPISPGRYRIIADIGASPLHEPAFEEVQAIVARRAPCVTLSDPIWLSGFRVNERKVENYRSGRAFLAGDAAHVHSPAGGQGMNTGMQDAFNLAWKLALVEQGHAGPDLLDSYSDERSAVAERVLAESGRLTRIATVKNYLLQDLRNFVAHRILGLSAARHAMAERLSEITIGYPASKLNAGSAKGLAGPEPGERILGERPFGAGEAPRFALLAGEDEGARAVLRRHASLLEPGLRKPPDEAGIWLVRPDGYVAAVARAGDWAVIEDCLAGIAAGALQAAPA